MSEGIPEQITSPPPKVNMSLTKEGHSDFYSNVEKMMKAKDKFVDQFENASVEQKQDAVTQFYSAIVDVYNASYQGRPIPIYFTKSEGYAFSHDGHLRIPLDRLERQTSDKAAFSLFHEYRHAMQSSLGIEKEGMGLPSLSALNHDLLPQEIDATKFAFANMDGLGFDKTKIDRYGEWQKAIRITDTFDSLRQNYGQEIADNMMDIYQLLEEHTFQTTRSDFSKVKLLRAKMVGFRSNIIEAKAKFEKLKTIAKSTNDTFLLNTVSNIKADWPKYHL